jgi:hypothetical protein
MFSDRLKIISAAIGTMAAIAIVLSRPGAWHVWNQNPAFKLEIIALAVFVFVGWSWKFSPPYWRLRDKMRSAITSRYGNKGALIIFTCALLVVFIVSLLYYT